MSRSNGINSRGHFRPRLGTIRIEHLGAEVRVKRCTPEAKEAYGLSSGCVAFTRGMMRRGYVELYFAEWVSPPTVAHECMHALQFISAYKMIDMEREREHVAYLIDYLVARVLGYRPEKATKQ